MIFAIHHRKGGVGKTTTCLNLAFAASLSNVRTLLIDLDGQANLTNQIDRYLSEQESKVGNLFKDQIESKPIVESNYIQKINPYLDIIPSSKHTFKISDEISNYRGLRGFLLKDILESNFKYEMIFMDTPPSAGHIVDNALIAADEILAPIALEAFAIEGIIGLGENIEELGKINRTSLQLGKLIPTFFHAGKSEQTNYLNGLRKIYGNMVTETVIRTDSNIPRSQSACKSIFHYDKKTRAAKDYANLAMEITA